MTLQHWTPRLLWLLAALLLALAGWNLWRITAVLRAAHSAAAQARQQPGATPVAMSAAQAWQRLLAAPLFGAPARGEAPPTTLPLKLEGVWATPGGGGYAMIAAEQAPARVHAAGSALPYGATLRSVQADRVLLDTAAGLQSLALPRPTGGGMPAAAEDGPDLQHPLPPQPGGAVPATAIEPPPLYGPKPMVWPSGDGTLAVGEAVLGVPVLRNGAIAGYMLRPGRDTAAFARLGLRPGDVLVGIDGRPVGGAAQVSARLRRILAAGGGRIEVERGGRALTLYAGPGAAP